jgi:hypothetical protein
MLVEIGHVEAIFRYSVKSMAGEPLAPMMQLKHGIFDEASISVIAISPERCSSFTATGSLPGGRVVGRCALLRRRGRRPSHRRQIQKC